MSEFQDAYSPMQKFSAAAALRTRRQFLQVTGAALTGMALSSCRRRFSDVQGGQAAIGTAGSATDTLHVYAWAGYFDDELLNSFREATGFRVIADIFDSNETMLAKMQAGGGSQYSIIYPSDYMVQQMVEMGMLQPLDKSKIEGKDALLSRFANPGYDPNNAHSVPANWGTTGLIYNPKLLSPAPQDWNDLWTNQRKISRRLTLFNDVREVMGATLRSLGHSYNTTNPEEIEAAYQKLLKLKPAIASFTTDGWRDLILSGDLMVAMAYSSDAIAVIAENPDLKYVIPASGSSLWVDTMAIPKTAPNPEAAYAWINFMLSPENAAKTSERLKLATAVKAAIDLLPAALRNDPSLFPTEAIINKCEGIAPVGDAAELYDRYWTQLTSL